MRSKFVDVWEAITSWLIALYSPNIQYLVTWPLALITCLIRLGMTDAEQFDPFQWHMCMYMCPCIGSDPLCNDICSVYCECYGWICE